MKNELKVIDPKEFGVEEKSAKSIELAFAPSISERNELSKTYDLLIKKEITPELIDEITVFDRQLQKCEKSIFNTHKSQKLYSLSLGRLIDAWKNKETDPIKLMREKCKEVKDHFNNIEREKIKVIRESRIKELTKYEVISLPDDLGTMDKLIYNHFLTGAKVNFENKKAESEKIEKQRIEDERLKKQFDERYKEMLPYSDFLNISLLTVNTSFEEYSNTLNGAIKDKKHSEEKAEKQAKENEVLKKQADARELKAKEESEKREKEESERLEKEKNEREARELKEREAKKESDALLEKERLKNKLAQDQLDAIAKQKADDLELEKSKGDKEHINDLISSLEAIKSGDKYTFKSKKNLVMFANVQGLIEKTIVFIKK